MHFLIRKNEGWNEELEELKKEIVRLKAVLRWNRESETALRNFHETSREYNRTMRASTKANWIRFVNEEMAGNEWGIPYKIAGSKIRPKEVLSLIGEAGEAGWERMARALLGGG